MGANPELPGIVGHDHCIADQTMMADGTPDAGLGKWADDGVSCSTGEHSSIQPTILSLRLSDWMTVALHLRNLPLCRLSPQDRSASRPINEKGRRILPPSRPFTYLDSWQRWPAEQCCFLFVNRERFQALEDGRRVTDLCSQSIVELPAGARRKPIICFHSFRKDEVTHFARAEVR